MTTSIRLGKNMSRRLFVKASAATAAAATIACQGTGLAPAEAHASEASPEIKKIRSHCRGCGKMECGIWIWVQNGRVIKVTGDESAHTSRGNLCSKGRASIQALYHPARVRYPMKRTNPKGEDPGWVRISWDEALEAGAKGFLETIDKFGPEAIKIHHGTGRVTTYAHEGFGLITRTPNGGSTAGQICKAPRFAASAMTCYPGSHFVELTGSPRVFFQWGTNQEVSNYDNAARVTVDAQANAEHTIVVGPRLQNLGKEGKTWVGLRPGTDDVIAVAMLNILLNEMKTYDPLFVKRWTNAPYLYVSELQPEAFTWTESYQDGELPLDISTHLLRECDVVEGGSPDKFAAWDTKSGGLVYCDRITSLWTGEESYNAPTKTSKVNKGVVAEDPGFGVDIDPAIEGEFEVTLKDGRTVKAVTVLQMLADSVAEWTPERAAEVAWCDPRQIREAAEIYCAEPGLGGIQYYLAIEQAGNAIQTCRAITILSALMGNLDTPGGNLGHEAMYHLYSIFMPNMLCLGAPPLTMEEKAKMAGADKFPLLPWMTCMGGGLNLHDMTTSTEMMLTGEPYRIHALLSNTGSHFHSANATANWEGWKGLDFYWGTELWFSPNIELADVVCPATHFLENSCLRYSQNAECGLGAMVAAVDPLAEARWDNAMIVQLAKHMGKPWWPPVKEAAPPWWPEEYLDVQWPNEQQMLDVQMIPSKLGFTPPSPDGETMHCENWDDFVAQYQEKGQWNLKEISALGYYQRWLWGWLRTDHNPGFPTPTGKIELLSTILETYHPGEELPVVREPFESPYSTPDVAEEYPIIFTTGRRNPVYFHNEHRQLPFCREQAPVPVFQVNPQTADELGIKAGDWCWIESKRGKIRQVCDTSYGIAPGVVEAEHNWWYPELKAPKHGWDLSHTNVLVDQYAQDPIIGSTTLRAYQVKIYKATPENSPFGNPVPCDEDGTEIITSPDDPRLKEWMPVYEGRDQ